MLRSCFSLLAAGLAWHQWQILARVANHRLLAFRSTERHFYFSLVMIVHDLASLLAFDALRILDSDTMVVKNAVGAR